MRSLLLAVLAFSTSAHAFVFAGNPKLTLDVDRPQHDLVGGDADLAKVRLHYCGGSYQDYFVSQAIDPVAGFTIDVASGDYCGATAFWSSTVYLDGNGQSGAFTLAYGQAFTYVPLSGQTQSADMTPYSVVDGFVFAGNPKLFVTIQ